MPKIACEIAFIAKNPHELLSRWDPLMSFRPPNLNPGPQRALNHDNKLLMNTSGFGSEFPIESPAETLEWVNEYRTGAKPTISDLFTNNIYLESNPMSMFSIERREVKLGNVGKLLFDLLDVRW